MQIKIKCDENTIAPLEATHFAQSAFDNNIDLDSFLASLDNFCNQSTSPVQDIFQWREEATEKYFTLLSEAGLLTWTATPFEGGSDFDDSETALGDINTNKKKNKEKLLWQISTLISALYRATTSFSMKVCTISLSNR